MGVASRVVAILLMILGGATRVAADPLAPAGKEVPDAVRAAVHTAIEQVYPALVRIHVVSVDYADGREVKMEGSGSGAIISPEGHVITNHHVAGKAKRIRCTLSNREEVEATLIGTDALADIAVIKLKLEGTQKEKPLPVAKFGDSRTVQVGDWVLAMGCPLALSQSVTLGIVSNVEMMLPSHMGAFRMDGEDVGSLVKWFGHDARIFPGNSGGPLVNMQGLIIGINEIGAGLGGAIPGNLARDVAEELIKHGEVRRSWIGLSVQPLLKSSKSDQGILVSGVLPNSPADKAGLKPGDIILSLAGKTFTVRFAEQVPEFNRLVLDSPMGKSVDVIYQRDGKEQKTSIMPMVRGRAEGPEAELKSWGIAVQDMSLIEAKELKREPNSGVVVTSVRPGGAVAEAKPTMAELDIITQVGGKPVHNIAELEAVTKELTKDHKEQVPVLVGFERRTERMLTVVRIGEGEPAERLGDVSRAWLGVSYQALTTDLAEALNMKGKQGIRLTEVFAGQTAAKSGLKVGDVIVKVDDQPLEVATEDDAKNFAAVIRRKRIGTKVELAIMRGGEPMKFEVQLAATPGGAKDLVEYKNTVFEFKTRDIQFTDRILLDLALDQKGALVSAVERGGWAALAHLRPGDLILAVDGADVQNVADLKKQMAQVEKDKPAHVVFFVKRSVHTMYVELEPLWPNK
jgi:serine protease Do